MKIEKTGYNRKQSPYGDTTSIYYYYCDDPNVTDEDIIDFLKKSKVYIDPSKPYHWSGKGTIRHENLPATALCKASNIQYYVKMPYTD